MLCAEYSKEFSLKPSTHCRVLYLNINISQESNVTLIQSLLAACTVASLEAHTHTHCLFSDQCYVSYLHPLETGRLQFTSDISVQLKCVLSGHILVCKQVTSKVWLMLNKTTQRIAEAIWLSTSVNCLILLRWTTYKMPQHSTFIHLLVWYDFCLGILTNAVSANGEVVHSLMACIF